MLKICFYAKFALSLHQQNRGTPLRVEIHRGVEQLVSLPGS